KLIPCWLVYAVVFGVAFLVILMFILIVCSLENAEENRYQVDDSRLIGEKNKYFFNGESMGIVNQDIELNARPENKDIYTTPTRMESYKVNPMFQEDKTTEEQNPETKSSTSNGQEGYIAI
ncbi:hypothetical protein, partial [Salmonella sp. s54412]|uniref:hypothetical protein n=1 Tax=Salmonella sp. s54412 TaxID=3160128 RepID=UPI0037546978